MIAVWGCGPAGQFAIRSAYLLAAGRVIAIDEGPKLLAMATEVLDFSSADILDELKDMTGGRGPDACIDAVGDCRRLTAASSTSSRSAPHSQG